MDSKAEYLVAGSKRAFILVILLLTIVIFGCASPMYYDKTYAKKIDGDIKVLTIDGRQTAEITNLYVLEDVMRILKYKKDYQPASVNHKFLNVDGNFGISAIDLLASLKNNELNDSQYQALEKHGKYIFITVLKERKKETGSYNVTMIYSPSQSFSGTREEVISISVKIKAYLLNTHDHRIVWMNEKSATQTYDLGEWGLRVLEEETVNNLMKSFPKHK